MKPNLNLVCDIGSPDQLPNQLVIRNGRIVLRKTGKPPVFPHEAVNGTVVEGLAVSVVPTADLKRLMARNIQRKLTLKIINEISAL